MQYSTTLPRHSPTSSPVMTAPGRGVMTHTRPSSHLPSDRYRPPQVWLTTRAHCRQHSQTSGTVPPGQSATDGQSRLLPHPGHCRPTAGKRRHQTTVRETNAVTKFDNMAATCNYCRASNYIPIQRTSCSPLAPCAWRVVKTAVQVMKVLCEVNSRNCRLPKLRQAESVSVCQ